MTESLFYVVRFVDRVFVYNAVKCTPTSDIVSEQIFHSTRRLLEAAFKQGVTDFAIIIDGCCCRNSALPELPGHRSNFEQLWQNISQNHNVDASIYSPDAAVFMF